MINGLCNFCQAWLLAAISSHPTLGQSNADELPDPWRSKHDLKNAARDDCWICVHITNLWLYAPIDVPWQPDSLLDDCTWFSEEEREEIGLICKLPDTYHEIQRVKGDLKQRVLCFSRGYHKRLSDSFPLLKSNTIRYSATPLEKPGERSYSLERLPSGSDSRPYTEELYATNAAENPDEHLNPVRFKFLSQMLQDCENTHTCISGIRTDGTNRAFLPERLLQVRSQPELSVKLVNTAELGNDSTATYATLSHCWGKIPFVTLTKSNLGEFRVDVPIHQLGKTFRETIKLCADLNIHYLWIDSLCIVQDSNDAQDWLKHAPIMDQVYGNAVLNFAACVSDKCYDGLFRTPNFEHYYDFSLEVVCEDSLYCYHIGTKRRLERWAWSDLTIFSRGWCIQELFLAPRVVYFGADMILWKCEERELAEIEGAELLTGVFTPCSKLTTPSLLDDEWTEMSLTYCSSSVTLRKDRVYALAGLAAWFGKRYIDLGVETQYCAGFWRHSLESQLIWHRAPWLGASQLSTWDRQPRSSDPLAYSDSQHILPSWSWMSASFQVDHRISSFDERLLGSVDLAMQLHHQDLKYGGATSIDLRLSALVLSLAVKTKPIFKPNDECPILDLGVGCSTDLEFVCSSGKALNVPCNNEADSCNSGRLYFDSGASGQGFVDADGRCTCFFVGICRTIGFINVYGLIVRKIRNTRPDRLRSFQRVGLIMIHLDKGPAEASTGPLVELIKRNRAAYEDFYLD